MNKKIFKGIFGVAIIAIFVTLLFIINILTSYFDRQIERELRFEAGFVADSLNTMGSSGMENYKSLGAESNRITWIAPDGTVLYDSVREASQMENHAQRTEVREAVEKGESFSIRYSSSLSQKTIYYAKLLEDGSIIRLSSVQKGIWVIFMGMLQPMLVIIVLGAVLAGILSNVISRKIVRPINEINLENPDIDEAYEELTPLIKKIRVQNGLISEQMEELTRKQREFGIITENMSEGLIIIDNQAEVLSYNPSVLKMFDIGPDRVLKNAYMINRSHVFIDAVRKALSGVHSEQETEVLGKNLLIIANPVLRNETVDGAIIILIDTTERKLREQMRREFTSNVSHELKTPLTSIYGVADMLASGIVKQEDVIGFSKDICCESRRMIDLINDIIRLSQLDEGNPVPEERKAVDLYVLAAMVEKRLKKAAQGRQITLLLEGEEGIAMVYGVETMLEEIIYNLCDNAIKYNREGGAVTIRTEIAAEGVLLQVEDTGIGIPQKDYDRIFERFYRVDKSHSRKIGGTGLGLSIVKHAVNYHNGRISVESSEGQGTAISILFPIEEK